MKWKHLFNDVITRRGQKYYNAGRVRNLTEDAGGTWHAVAMGSDLYKVSVSVDENEKITKMRCTCPYAKGGLNCKHMAAVCCEIEEQIKTKNSKQKSESERNEKILENPFKKQASSGEYYYFDLNYMTRNFEITDLECIDAENMINSGRATLDDIGFRYGSEHEGGQLFGHINGYCGSMLNRYTVSIRFDRDGIRDLYCLNPDCRIEYSYWGRPKRKLCTHELVLLFLLEDYIIKNNPGDATDQVALEILERYHRSHTNTLDADVGGIKEYLRLEPRLVKSMDMLSVSFKVGTNKLFVIKNLTEFVSQVENGEEATFGKDTVIHFGHCVMDEQTRLLYEFIKENVEDSHSKRKSLEMKSRRYYYDYEEVDVKADIPLSGTQMDKIYSLIENRKTEYTNKNDGKRGRHLISCREGSINLQMSIEKQIDKRNIFEGIKVSGDIPFILEGNQAAYTITDDQFLERIPKEDIKEILPIYEMADYEGHLSFNVGRGNLSTFYHTVFPILKKHAVIDEPDSEEIDKYLPPEVNFKFFLDAEDDNLTCKVIADYDGKTFSVMDVYDTEKIKKEATSRDIYREEEAAYIVEMFFPVPDFENEIFHCDRNEDAIFDVLNHGIDEMMAFGEVQGTDRFKRLSIRKAPKVSVGVSVESSLLDLTVTSNDFSQDELMEVLFNYRKKKKYYRLKNGDFVNLEEESLETLANMMEALHITPKEFVKGKMHLPVYRALYLDKMLESNSGIYAKRDSSFRGLVKEFKTIDDSEFEVPEELQMTMRNYQITGYKWLRMLENYGFGGILADDMGLGKTLQMIAVFLAWKKEGVKEPVLVVSPASLVYNWQDEFNKFAPELKACIVAGSQKERAAKLHEYQNYDVLVTSYDLLKRDIAEYDKCKFHCQVLDEAQYIKNHITAAAKAVRLINADVKYALTGTPIENRLSELWSIFDYLMPGFLYAYDVFKKEIETPIVKNKDKNVSERLRRMVGPFIMRRLKKDVLKDLPDKLEKVYYAEMEDEQQKLYDAQVTHMKNMLEGQSNTDYNKDRIKILAELTKIRQICCDPELIYEDYFGGSAKRAACMELIEQAIEGEHRMLVFSQFTSMLALLEEELKSREIEYYKITGETPKKRRIEMVNDFNEGHIPVFLISLKAGGTGLNLTGADIVIHYDPWWNLAVQNQATDRAHRIGQTNVVSVYRLIAKNTIEEKILRMQESKKDLADKILSGANGGLATLGKDELLELLGV